MVRKKRVKKITLTALLDQVFKFKSYGAWQILRENEEIHRRYGFDNDKVFSFELNDEYVLTFKPDQFDDNYIYEAKVVRKYSNEKELIAYGTLQASIEAYLLDKKAKLILIRQNDRYKIDELEIDEKHVENAPKILETLFALYSKRLQLREELKRMVIADEAEKKG